MSWWGRSLVDSIRAAAAVVDDDDNEEEEQPMEIACRAEQSDVGSQSGAQEVEEDEEQDNRGVKEDFSELTKTLTRQFWGVASFLAPAPASLGPDDASDPTAGGLRDEATPVVEALDSPRIAGIRNDFAEISGKFRSGISSVLSHTKTVSEISKIASSILPFGLEEEREDDEDLLDAIGINEEVLAFARNVSMHPETWLDFPLPHGEEDSKDFELSDAQLEHAVAIERLAPEFSDMRSEICPRQMSEESFWKIYFVLLQSRLNSKDAELLSTPQIVEARAALLQELPSQRKPGSERLGEASFNKDDGAAIPLKENVTAPTSTANVTIPPNTVSYGESVSESIKDIEAEKHSTKSISSDSTEEVETEKHPVLIEASGSMEDAETDKHPVPATEVKIIDKSVTEEEPANGTKIKDITTETSKSSVQTNEEDGDGWLEDDIGEANTTRGATVPLGQEEDVSFSDLEVDDDDDQGPTISSKTIPVDSQAKVSRASATGDQSTGSEMKESNDWLDLEDFDVE
ncbi:uncharacterized protein LOC121988897 [Zingiber officinale]|uniref:BSD domain-containing protein n=1 Tax=Zingiber officinale TaxID=94328 RepID=A0A8J5LQV8_ZINOF|nr:uncharacterized protein LOC121988897 [Zingiber officinale]KAG6534685.1 hypothetical protein ZIOFF_008588 [Zingiber officinale]